eukprot:SAG31_NODE_9221_length_1314_cov_1.274074_1_plen_111_part_10
MYAQTRTRFVSASAMHLETSQPQLFGAMYEREGYAMKGLETADDGKVYMQYTGQVVLNPASPHRSTVAGETTLLSVCLGSSPAATDVVFQDFATFLACPYVRELPDEFFNV